jgi:hypothetical protein
MSRSEQACGAQNLRIMVLDAWHCFTLARQSWTPSRSTFRVGNASWCLRHGPAQGSQLPRVDRGNAGLAARAGWSSDAIRMQSLSGENTCGAQKLVMRQRGKCGATRQAQIPRRSFGVVAEGGCRRKNMIEGSTARITRLPIHGRVAGKTR